MHDVWYLGDDGEPRQIGPKDGIDVLTSVKHLDFDEHHGRATLAELHGLTLPIAAKDDLAVMLALRD